MVKKYKFLVSNNIHNFMSIFIAGWVRCIFCNISRYGLITYNDYCFQVNYFLIDFNNLL